MNIRHKFTRVCLCNVASAREKGGVKNVQDSRRRIWVEATHTIWRI